MAGIEWLFEIDATPATYFGTKSTTFDAKTYYGLVNPSFRGLPSIRIKTEMNSHANSKFSFEVMDNASTFAASDFEGKEVIIRMVSSSVELQAWRFVIETAQESHRSWKINCKDFLSTLIDGVWPNTGLVKDIFPERYVKRDGELQISESDCLPMVFGTTYIPLSSIFDTPDVKFVLGESGPTYTITELTTPRDQDGPSTFSSGVTYTQSTVSSTRVFIPTLNAGSIDMWWRSGQRRLAPVVKFSRNDTASLTNIINVIKYVIKDFGAVDADFDSTSWTAAAATITSRGLTFNKGYYKHQSRSSVLCNLLNIAGATLIIGETIEIYLNSKSSAATITTSNILGNTQNGPGSFKYTKNLPNSNNSGAIAFSTINKPEDDLVTVVVPALGSTSDPVNKTLSVVGINDTQDAQKVGIFHYQKLLNSLGRISFKTPYSAPLRVGRIITVYDSGGMYGESKTVEIDSLLYNKNTTIEVEGIVRNSTYVQDWGDISPSAVSVSDSPTANEITVLSKATDAAATYTDTYAVLVADAGTLAYSDFIDGNTLSVTAAYSTSGLYMNKDYIGFWDQPAGAFANYMSLNGDFRAGGVASNYMFFDESAGTLNINGSISVQNPTGVRSDLNVENGADVTGTHTANNASNYTGSTISTSYTSAKCTDPLADQTSTHQSASTAAVGSYSWTVYNNWVTNGTQINGTSIATDTVYLNRLYALTGSVSFVGCQMTFQNGSDLELQSTADGTSTLEFSRGSYSWNTYLTGSGSNFVVGPTSFGTTTYTIGNSYLNYAVVYSTTTSSLHAGASNVNHAHINCYNSSPRVVISVGPVSAKYYTFSITALYTSSSMALGESGNRWSNTYTTLLNVSSTATMAAINATGNVAPSANNTYTCGTASYKWSQLHTYLFYCSYITPLVDSTYNCGHTSYGWAQVYTDNMRIGDSVFDGIAPFAANNCLIGNSTYYFGAMYAYKYWSKVADGTFDSLDDLQILDDMGPIKDKDGKYIPHGRGFKGPRQRDMHPAITNFDDLPKMFKEEYRIDITKEELHAILHESADPIDVPNITVTKDYLKNNKDDLKGWLKRRGDTQIGIIDVEEVHEKGEDYIIKNPIIDADFIESQLFNDMGKEAQLYEGAIRQLNKRVKKERIEYQATIEGLIERINRLEKKVKNN
ncbi:MAG: hypothetical protein GY861_19110 [bacterium]|nr:hypothetical protein [bacterium]